MASTPRTRAAGVIASFILAGSAWAGPPALDPVFSDHMVVQRDRAIRVWGTADPGVTVAVELAGRTANAVATRAAGHWHCRPCRAADPTGCS